MKRLLLHVSVLIFHPGLYSQGPPVILPDSTVIYLVGDAGNDETPGPALQLLQKRIRTEPNSTVIFLGDNIYPKGMNDKLDDEIVSSDEKKMLSQVSMFKGFAGNVFMVPGNHDWKAERSKGLDWVIAQQIWVDKYFKDSASTVKNSKEGVYFPKNGLPGPNSILLNDKLRLIMMDSQWFIQKHNGRKVGKLAGAKKRDTERNAWSSLEGILKNAVAKGEQVILAVHHPMISAGKHGTPKTFQRIMINHTPFYLFGLAGLNRPLSQNSNWPAYKKFRKTLEVLLKKYGKNHILVAGHEHNFQVWKMEWGTQVISGSGSKKSGFKKHNIDDPRLLDKNDSREGITRLVIRNVGGARVLHWEFLY